MIGEQFDRTTCLLGEAAMQRLKDAKVAVFGIGGVGGYVCEALVRSGIGAFDLIDADLVSLTNLNRQIIATHETIGQKKVDVMRERMKSINPEVAVSTYPCFFLPENAEQFRFEEYDYVVDAVDTVTAKLAIISCARKANVPVISAMGAGNKRDASRFRVSDLFKTQMDPLAKVMRHECKKRGIDRLKVVWSDEPPMRSVCDSSQKKELSHVGRTVPGSLSYVPAVAGLLLAGEVIADLTGEASR